MNCLRVFVRSRATLLALSSVVLPFSIVQLHAADPFAEGVRPTDWLKPEDEQKVFKLPPGFEIQLVAAEPDILKPMNMAFDAQGRLWVTVTQEYPYPAPTNRPARDAIKILEDFDANGRARKITTFVDGLNIPIGIFPYKNGCLAWSIPNIWFFQDTDGDGKSDKRDVFFGPFDYTRDTHGNQASFHRGFDGWLYATHGYNNDSHVKGPDGNQVDLNSGNTYRMRLDGSRIEQHTWGQVNPFGLAFDPQGNLYSSDCHSAPIYQLLSGGYYPSFGKPHDGLGFAPTMMEQQRGSTALDGISYYADNLWPEEYKDSLFLGDVMSSAVFRDKAVEVGGTKIAKARPNFVATTDPWFRPVDTRFGPDGALYIADFYNKIIGHYEVPLAHPGRDRTSGRIWRVVYRGTEGQAKLHPAALPRDLKGLLTELGSPNLTRRFLAQHEITDRFSREAVQDLRTTARGAYDFGSAEAKAHAQVHALWALMNLNELDEESLLTVIDSKERLLRIHGMRLVAEHGRRLSAKVKGTQPAANRGNLLAVVRKHLEDPDGLVQRCAADALSVWPDYGNIQPLLSLIQRVPKEDTHLLYVARKALRDQLTNHESLQRLKGEQLSDAQKSIVGSIALAVKSPVASAFLLQQLPMLSKQNNPQPPIAEVLKHVARYAPETELGNLAAYAQGRIPAGFGTETMFELGRQFALFRSLDEGLQQRGVALPTVLREWGTNLVWRFFTSLDSYHSWIASPLEGNATEIPWDSEKRKCADGKTRELTSSFPRGETLTGVLRSKNFSLPQRLSFWLCGHNGSPDKPDQKANVVRLRDAQSKAVLAETFPPRNDTARQIVWELPQHVGKSVFVEVIDADDGPAYAWLAFGNFEPQTSQLRPSEFQPARMNEWMTAAAEIAVRAKMKETASLFADLSTGRRPLAASPDVLGSFAKAWMALAPAEALKGLSSALANNAYVFALERERIAELLAAQNSDEAQKGVVAAMKASPLKSQEKVAYVLATTKFGGETLLSGIESGAISPRVLQRVGVNNRLKTSKPTDWEARVAKLTKGLTAADDARERLITERRAGYAARPGKVSDGQQVYAKNCAACHSINRVGGNVGPQLDGIGTRGLDRLCEDIIDPNRNLDHAFKSTLLVLKDGEVVSGLFRREEGELLVLAESTGKEVSVPKKDISERRVSETSLMPENFGELLSAQDFNDLMAYLLAQGPSK